MFIITILSVQDQAWNICYIAAHCTEGKHLSRMFVTQAPPTAAYSLSPMKLTMWAVSSSPLSSCRKCFAPQTVLVQA